MKIKHSYEIRRSDKRDRCGKCLEILEGWKYRVRSPSVYRFPNFCWKHYQLFIKEKWKNPTTKE